MFPAILLTDNYTEGEPVAVLTFTTVTFKNEEKTLRALSPFLWNCTKIEKLFIPRETISINSLVGYLVDFEGNIGWRALLTHCSICGKETEHYVRYEKDTLCKDHTIETVRKLSTSENILINKFFIEDAWKNLKKDDTLMLDGLKKEYDPTEIKIPPPKPIYFDPPKPYQPFDNFNLPRTRCFSCNGTGRKYNSYSGMYETCPNCNGLGYY